MAGAIQQVLLGGVGAIGNDSFTKILLHMEGSNGGVTFTDDNSGGSPHTWTPASATTSTVAFEFGASSMLSAVGGVSTPDSTDFTLGSGDWTVDFWLNRNGNSGTMGLFGQGNSTLTSSSIAAGFTAGNILVLSYNSGSTVVFNTAITGSTWTHIAIVNHAGVITAYINGVAEATTGASSSFSDLASAWWVGARGDFSGAKHSGYIDEFRLSVGVARWTANFTPPTSPYGP